MSKRLNEKEIDRKALEREQMKKLVSLTGQIIRDAESATGFASEVYSIQPAELARMMKSRHDITISLKAAQAFIEFWKQQFDAHPEKRRQPAMEEINRIQELAGVQRGMSQQQMMELSEYIKEQYVRLNDPKQLGSESDHIREQICHMLVNDKKVPSMEIAERIFDNWAVGNRLDEKVDLKASQNEDDKEVDASQIGRMIKLAGLQREIDEKNDSVDEKGRFDFIKGIQKESNFPDDFRGRLPDEGNEHWEELEDQARNEVLYKLKQIAKSENEFLQRTSFAQYAEHIHDEAAGGTPEEWAELIAGVVHDEIAPDWINQHVPDVGDDRLELDSNDRYQIHHTLAQRVAEWLSTHDVTFPSDFDFESHMVPAMKMFGMMKEAAPDGWEGTVKAMKKHDDINNPFALAHWMKNKGYKSHKQESMDEPLMPSVNFETVKMLWNTIRKAEQEHARNDDVSQRIAFRKRLINDLFPGKDYSTELSFINQRDNVSDPEAAYQEFMQAQMKESVLLPEDFEIFKPDSLERYMVEMIFDEMKSHKTPEEISESLGFHQDDVQVIFNALLTLKKRLK